MQLGFRVNVADSVANMTQFCDSCLRSSGVVERLKIQTDASAPVRTRIVGAPISGGLLEKWKRVHQSAETGRPWTSL